jgi:hypothetical protein
MSNDADLRTEAAPPTTAPAPGSPGPAPSRPPTVTAHRGRVIGFGVLAGLVVAVLWSAQLADDDIGMNVATGVLGNTSGSAITSTATGLLFAFVTGLAGTFTACNVAVFSAVGPMVEHGRGGSRLAAAFRPLIWLALGAVVVAGGYGAIGALLGGNVPQLSTATVGPEHLPVRTIQSIVVFGVIGLIMLYLALAAVRYVPDPLARASARWAPARSLVMGALIGGFLIGRPWPLFHEMFAHAAQTHNAGVGALTFVLIVLGNMVLTAILFALLTLARVPEWMRRRPTRLATVTAASLAVGGAFTLFYWAVRVPAGYGIGWFPVMPWH